ncbi:MAG: tetratricopeptide repeat protein, partial [Acidobacteria bacterium]|nr:tetratricopeptide repeat protein [Acidobacteriota bacterium]
MMHAVGLCRAVFLSLWYLLVVLVPANGGAYAIGQTQMPVVQGGSSSLIHDATTLLQAGRFEEAEEIARRAVTAHPRDPNARAVLGVILEQRGQANEAEREYREALRLDRNSTVALANLGVLLGRTGRGDQAIATFERVLRLAPDHSQATFNLGALYAARKEYSRAIPLLESAAGIGKQASQIAADPVLLIMLANAYAHVKRSKDAEKLFELIERGAKDDPRVLFTLGLSVAET